MDAFKPSRSGMTYAPLTDGPGGELLTWYLAGFPVRTFPPLEKGPASQGNAPACGGKWRESSVRLNLSTSLWKTHRDLWEEEVPESSVILPSWGILDAHGVLWERTMPGHPIAETASGSSDTPFPTPTAGGHTQNQSGYPGAPVRPTLLGMARMGVWPPPCASEARQGLQIRRPGKKGSQQSLSTMVHFWPTPCAMEPEKNLEAHTAKQELPRAQRGGGNGDNLATAVKRALWPTPKVASGDSQYQPGTRKKVLNLSGAVKFSTPRASDCNRTRQNATECTRRREAAGQATLTEQIANEGNGGQLNPTWVEWLMGWPLGWTDCAVSATDKFQQWCASHGRHWDGELKLWK